MAGLEKLAGLILGLVFGFVWEKTFGFGLVIGQNAHGRGASIFELPCSHRPNEPAEGA